MIAKRKITGLAAIEAIESRIFMSVVTPPIVVTPPPAQNMLVLIQQPKMGNQGQPLGLISIEIFDPTGNLATTDNSNVTMSGNALTGTTTVAAQDGVAVFSNLIINTTGTETLTATDANATSVDTQPIVVTNTVTAGKWFAPITMTPTNAKWLKVKLVNTLTGKVALTRTFYPKRGSALVVNNLASFTAGNFDVVSTDSLGQSATLEQVTVSPAAAHELWFSSQPRVLDGNAVVTVSVLDQYGNLTTLADGSNVALHSWLPKGTPGTAPVLSGNKTAIVADGVATFTGLTMNQTGEAHLIARLGDLKPTVSDVFQQGATLSVDPGNNGPVS